MRETSWDERRYLIETLFGKYATLQDGDDPQFAYAVPEATRSEGYGPVPEGEREIVEAKIQDAYVWRRAIQLFFREVKNAGLEYVVSDEDVCVLPFLVLHGAKTSLGTIATLLPSFGTDRPIDRIGGRIEVYKPEWYLKVVGIYGAVKERYGFRVESIILVSHKNKVQHNDKLHIL